MKNILLACALCTALTSTAAAQPVFSAHASAQTSGQKQPHRVKPAGKKSKPQKRAQQPVRKPQPAAGAAQGSRAQPKRQAQPRRIAPTATQPDSIGNSLAALGQKAGRGEATGADVQRLGQQLAGAASGSSNPVAARRLRRTVDDLGQRASKAQLTAQDVAVLHEQWIDARLDRALNGLASRAGQQRLTPDDFTQLSGLLQERAAAARSVDPKAGAARKQLQGQISRLQDRTATHHLIASDFDPLRTELNSARLNRALADLERRSLSKNANAEDVARVNDRIDDQASGAHVDPKLSQKLRTAIGDLKARALRGEVTRAEFSELRSSLTKRARNAAQKK
ncbi:MAG: hypothetical protein ACI8QZ_002166 [Chlamydiales bacterium]|jgi:hypothetical protein